MPEQNEIQRGDETRQKLLEAGLRVFGALGYEGASTRALAGEAGVNLAAIPYHFGGKQGLYLAVAAHVAGHVGDHLLPLARQINTAHDQGKLDHDEARALLHRLLRLFARLIIASEEAGAWAAFVYREHADPTEAFDILYERVFRHVSRALTALVGLLTDADPASETVQIRAATLIGQIMVFRTQRAGILRTLGWSGFDEESAETIMDIVLEHVDASLDRVRGA